MSYFVTSLLTYKVLGEDVQLFTQGFFFYKMVNFIMVLTAEVVTCFRDFKNAKK